MKLIDELSRVLAFTRKVETLLLDQLDTNANISALDARLRKLEDRMVHLEADRTQMVTEARAAAGAVATHLANVIVSDVVTRITRLEMRHEELQKRLS